LESVLCHESDCFPRILCFFPLAIGLVFGCVFAAPNSSVTAAPGVKPALAAIGFTTVGAVLFFWAAGLPHFRAHGLAGGCRALAAAAAAAARRAPPPPPAAARGGEARELPAPLAAAAVSS
jgi:hypothetical protein